ncbi:MAG TPA: tail fiber domain-containing protein, partial [Verrucomicrobiae bacterium]
SSGVTVYGTFNNSSDRNAKQDFASVSPADILDKVVQLPVSEWSYKEDAGTRHIGPMGQDFYSTFNIGTDEKHIAPIDEGGVALAAIKGLNQKVEEQKGELKKRDEDIAQLRQNVAELKQLVSQLVQGRPGR